MSKKSVSAGTLTLGLLLIVIGILFLLANFTNLPVWRYAWRYWPLILIFFGLSKIIQSITQGQKSRAGEILLIIFIIIAGLIITQFATYEPPFRIDWWHDDYTYESEEQVSCQPGSNIVITNQYGDVEVTSWSEDEIKVIMTKQVWAKSEREADRYQRDIRLVLENILDKVEISADLSEVNNNRDKFNINFKVIVPEYSLVEISCYEGDVFMDGLSGEQSIENRYGDVQVTGIDGDLSLRGRDGYISIDGVSGKVEIISRNTEIKAEHINKGLEIDNPNGDILASSIGDELLIKTKHSKIEVYDILGNTEIKGLQCDIKIHNIDGNLYLENNYNSVEVEEISGKTEIRAPNSKIYVREIANDLTIESSYETVEAENIEGKAEIMGENLQVILRDIGGPIDVSTSYNNVTLYSWKAPVTIENKSGEIALYDCFELGGAIDLTTSENDIILELPADSSFNIDAKAFSGSINSQFSGPNLKLIQDDDEASLQGSFNQGLYNIRLRVENGNIRIEKSEKEIEL